VPVVVDARADPDEVVVGEKAADAVRELMIDDGMGAPAWEQKFWANSSVSVFNHQ